MGGWFQSNKNDPVTRSPAGMMSLPIITNDNGYSIGTINKTQRIFLLCTNKGEYIVLKAEPKKQERGENFSGAYAMMGVVQKMGSVPLTQAEIDVINAWPVGGNLDFRNARTQMNSPGGSNDFWIKTTYIPKETNMKFVTASKKSPSADEDLQERAAKLAKLTKLSKRLASNKTAWKELGEIAAVDCFNGNTDRFVFVQMKGDAENYVQNWGNIMFREEKVGPFNRKVVHAVGLDAYDPQANQTNDEGGYWEDDNAPLLDPKNTQKIDALLGNIFAFMKKHIGDAIGRDPGWKAADLKAFKEGYYGGIAKMQKAVVKGKVSRSGLDRHQKKKVEVLGWG